MYYHIRAAQAHLNSRVIHDPLNLSTDCYILHPTSNFKISVPLLFVLFNTYEKK